MNELRTAPRWSTVAIAVIVFLVVFQIALGIFVISSAADQREARACLKPAARMT